MSRFERQCRLALRAFPAGFRAERQEEMLSTLKDAARDEPLLSLQTALDLVAAGLRMRAVRSRAGRGVRGGLQASVELAALLGLGLQAAIAIATGVYFYQHRVVFYLLPTSTTTPLFAEHLRIWAGLAVCWTLAFLAALRGRSIIAAGLSLAATSYLLAVAIDLFLSAEHQGTQLLVATPAFLAVALIAFLCAAASSRRSGPRRAPRSWRLAVLVGTMAVVFALIGDGAGATGRWPDISYTMPPQGGMMTALQYVWGGGVVIGLVWSRFDPRAGWATAILSLPFLAYQISSFTLGNFYYGQLYQSEWKPILPMIGACLAIVLLSGMGALAQRRLRRL